MNEQEVKEAIGQIRYARAQQIAVKFHYLEDKEFTSPNDVQAWFEAEAGGDEELALIAGQILSYAYKFADVMMALSELFESAEEGSDDDAQ